MNVFVLGKENTVSKNGKELFKLYCGRILDTPTSCGMSVFTAFTNQTTYENIMPDLTNEYDLAVFFKENGFHNVYLKKGEKK